MNKKKVFNGLVVLLILINIIALGYTLIGKKPIEGLHPTPKVIVIEKLDFDKHQKEQYFRLIEKHHEEMVDLRMEMKSAKNTLFENLASEAANKDSLIAIVNGVHLKIETLHYQHFEDIKRICRVDQLDNFRALSSELAHIFGPQRPAPNRKRRPKASKMH